MAKTSAETLLISLNALKEKDFNDPNSKKIMRFLNNMQGHFKGLAKVNFDALQSASNLLNSLPDDISYYHDDMSEKLEKIFDKIEKFKTSAPYRNLSEDEQDTFSAQSLQIFELLSASNTKKLELEQLNKLKVNFQPLDIHQKLSQINIKNLNLDGLSQEIDMGKVYLEKIKTILYTNFDSEYENVSFIQPLLRKEFPKVAKKFGFHDKDIEDFKVSPSSFFKKAFPLTKEECKNSSQLYTETGLHLSQIFNKNEKYDLSPEVRSFYDLYRNIDAINLWITHANGVQRSTNNAHKFATVNKKLLETFDNSPLLEMAAPKPLIRDKLIDFLTRIGTKVKNLIENIKKISSSKCSASSAKENLLELKEFSDEEYKNIQLPKSKL